MSKFGTNLMYYEYIEKRLWDLFKSYKNDLNEFINQLEIQFFQDKFEEVFNLDFKLIPNEMGLVINPTVFEPEKQMIGLGFETINPINKFSRGFLLKRLYNNIRDYDDDIINNNTNRSNPQY